MRVRPHWLALVILLVPWAAHAHDHFADYYFAAPYQHGSHLVGFHFTFSRTVAEPPAASSGVKRLTFLLDLSPVRSVRDTEGEDHTWRLNYLGGVRYTFARDGGQKNLPFVHVLMGGAYVNTAGDGNNDPVVAFGAGFEHVFGNSPHGLGLRSQLDYIVRQGEVSPRVSIGIVYRK